MPPIMWPDDWSVSCFTFTPLAGLVVKRNDKRVLFNGNIVELG